MRSYTLRFLGVPLWTLEVQDWEVDAEEEETVEESVKPKGIVGGSTHNFEMDATPFAPEDQFAEEWSDDRRVKLGFKA